MATQKDQPTRSPNLAPLPEWKLKLQQRGILDAALEAGVHEYIWDTTRRKTPGWAIPLFDEQGRPYTLGDGRAAQRWKNLDSDGKPKYRFGYPGLPSGQTTAAGCDIYFTGADIHAVVSAADGVLHIACGEPDAWTLVEAGFRNVISFFGEKNIPKDLCDRLKRWGVRHVRYYPDRDKTGGAAAAELASTLAGSDIELTIYALPETVNDQPIKDINDLNRALGCDPDLFRLQLEALPVETVCAASMPPAAPELGPVERSASGRQSEHRDLPEGFYQAIEQQLGVQDYDPGGWSKPVACPFQTHEHDDRRPAAQWHPDKHILHCFKCGRTRLAVETGAVLGLDWRDYTDKQRPGESSEEPAGSPLEQQPPATAEPASGRRQPKPTDDVIGVNLIRAWNGDYGFLHEQWHHYQAGVWKQEANIEKLIWDAMVAAKSQGVKPTSAKGQSVKDFLQAQLYVPDEQIDCQDHLINLQNGVYNLETGQLEPHRREFYLTTQLDYAYNPEAKCPRWLRYLDEVLITPSGEPDRELQSLLQEAMGYTLTTDTSFEKAFVLCGPGASGKSQVIRVLQGLLVDAHVSLNLNALVQDRCQLAKVPGKRAITCTEAASRAVLVDELIKQLVSGEELLARPIYGKPFNFTPQAKIWWAVNELPENNDRSDGIYRRLIIIPFERAIPPDQQDRKLREELRMERPGIFNLVLEGLARLLRNGQFTQSARVIEAVQDYKAENDVEAAFVADEEWVVLNLESEDKAGEFYQGYHACCEDNGHRAVSNTRFAAHCKRLGLKKVRRSDGYYYLGVALTSMAADRVRSRRR